MTEPRFLSWYLQGDEFVARVEASSTGVSYPAITASAVMAMDFGLPQYSVQQTIADYLDRETAQIDALIAKQEQLVATLLERRWTTIRTGTGWIGANSTGWPRKRLSWVFSTTGSGTTPSPDEILPSSEGLIPWVTTGELREQVITETRAGVTAETLASHSALRVHPAGSILIAMYGATIGRSAVLGIDAASNQACCALIQPRDANTEFVHYSLVASRDELVQVAAGGGQPNVNQDKIRSFRIPLPPLEEQREIVAYLDEQTSKIDLLISKAEQFIALSRERRAALITAAVTGQLDVTERAA